MKTYRSFIGITFVLLMVVVSSTGTRAQQNNRGIKHVNLFEYGSPVTDAQINFENFRANFTSCIQNADEIDWLETTYIGKIKNSQQAKELLRHNIRHGAPAWGLSSKYSAEEAANSYFRLNTAQHIDTTQINTAEMINTLASHYIHTGDAVYAMKLVDPDLHTFDYYVFVDAKTKHVIAKGNMLAFELPINYIQRKTTSKRQGVLAQ